jgi:hypothetical protein
MTIQVTPYALQNASHSAALFRQSASAAFMTAGVLSAGELAVTAQATPNMSVVLGPGRAKVAGTSVSPPAGMSWTTQAMYDVLNDAALTLTVTTSNATNPRIDALYGQVQDSFYSGATNTAIAGIAAGVPSPSPVAPSVPTNSILLAYIAVGANVTAIVAGNITVNALPAVTVGGMTRIRNQAARDAQPAVLPGQAFYLLDSDKISARNGAGTGWLDTTLTSIAYTPSLTFSGTLVNLGAGGSVVGKYSQIGKMVFFRVEITFGTAAAAGAGNLELTFPVPATSSGIVGQAYYYNGSFNTFVAQNTGTTMVFRRGQGTSDTWGSAYAPVGPGNVASISGQYEAT